MKGINWARVTFGGIAVYCLTRAWLEVAGALDISSVNVLRGWIGIALCLCLLTCHEGGKV